MKCLNKSLPLVQDLLKVIPNEGAVAILFDRLGENATYEEIIAENQRLTQEAIRATSSIKPGVEEFYQVTSKEIESADKKLDEYLIDFLKPFGVTTKEVEALKNRLGEDSLGIADVINKVITVTKNRKIDTIPEEAGHMITMLMGENHPEIKALLNSIDKWSGYKAVYDEYWDRYYNEKQIKIEAVGKVIAKALVQKFKEQDVSIFNQAKKVINAFFAILSRISPFKTSFYTYHLADKIATNVLLGNTSYVANITPSQSRLNYKKTINENPFGKYIIDTFTERFGFSLTGSLAIAGQGEVIYRPETEPIHDLDFVVEDKNKMKDVAKFLEESNAIPLHHGIKGDDYITLSYYIPKKGFTVEPSKVTNYGFVSEIQLKNEKGEYVEPTAQNVIGVDFFVYNAISKERKPTSIFSSWQDIYKGKLVLSPLKSRERMFQRPKDQIDYILSVPVEREYQLPEFTYLQTEEVPTSVASPEMIAKTKELLKKMGVVVQDIVEYAKGSGLKLNGVNGVADLTRRIVAIAEGKEDVAIVEEMVHVATSIVEQKNPKLITELISKIDRFKIYKQVYEQYKNIYTLPNGKPDIRKIKKEAVDKLISELIIYNNQGSTEFPELMDETNRSIIRTFWEKILDWFRGMYKTANIDIFQEAAAVIEEGVEGDIVDMDSNQIYYQLSDPQKAIQQRILQTQDGIKKVEDKQATDPILLDTEEASNWYEAQQPDGTWARVTKRVTDRVKAWYKQRFAGKVFTEEEKRFNEAKRKLGVKGHKFFEEIHGRYFNSDGTRKKNADVRATKLSLVDEEVYQKLENYYVSLLDKFSKDGKNPLVFSEVIIYDPKEKEAGTIDLLIVEENGKANIIDWKFMSVAAGAKDVAWYKQGAYNIQLGRYKDILRDRYGVKEFGMNRAVPIIMNLKQKDPKIKTSDVQLAGIAIGSVNTEEIEDLRLVPVSEETESTGFERLDELIKRLNAAYKQIAKKVVTEEDEREFKRDRLNILKEAIRVAQGTLNIAPLVDVIKVMRKEGQQIIDDYNTTYKGRPANSQGEDFTDEKLSDFSATMREYSAFADVFGRIDDLIGELIYNKDMEKAATTEEAQEDIANRKELLKNISNEAREIRLSSEQIKKVSGEFADKFIGQKNLVKGLLSPEAIVKGLSSTFRGVSELPMASLQVLYKLVTNAKGRASRDALGEVDRLMAIRKKLVDRGGDIRQLVQQIYQKDDKNKLVNKLVYKFEKAFFEGVDNNALEGARDKKWLMDNIDIEAYRKEAKELLDKKIERIKKLHDENEELMERLILEEKQKWDIDRKDFIGWTNYIIKRHPLPKWKSEQYKQLEKDPDLLELYNFISEMNQKAKSSGYISNKVASTFLPFIRKGMAESLAWDFDLSAVMNFGKNLQIQADDVGYGQTNELTGELENAIPKYYTYDFTRREDGVNDYSDVSEDIFKNMILYINHMEKYKYLSEVEDQLQLVKTIETFKGYLNTDRVGEVVYIDGKPQVMAEGQSTSEGNAKIFNDFLRALLYEQKYPLSDSDTPLGIGKVSNFIKSAVNNVAGREVFKPEENPSATSLVKTMDAANRAFQLKTLGLEFISGAVNAFGANIQIATQAGNYFKAREVLANEMKLVGNKFKNDEERQMFLQLIDAFMPLKDDPTYEKLKKSGLTTLTKGSFSDFLMVFMREPEQHIEKSIFLTLLDNMMVEDGKIISIREFVKRKYKDRYDSASRYKEVTSKIDEEIEELKKTKSINATKKLVDGKLEIPGLDLSNVNELQRLTNLTRRISRNATGGLSDSDLNRMGMNIWTKSMMIFKNWIPKLVDTRFGEFRKVSDDFSVEIGEDGLTTGEKYDIGRIRLFAYVLGTSIRDRSTNLINILSLNEKGLTTLNEMYEEFAQQYEKRTGKPLEMDRDEFIDMIRTNLRNQVKELAILMSMFGAMFALGFAAPDDDDDRADKNFHRYAQRTIDKFIGELSFFYNPAEFQKILSGSMFPAIGIFSDIGRFTSHTMMEMTGIDTSNPDLTEEQVRKKAQPVKNFGKMFPISKSLFTYGGILDADFAKEFDITIQKESRR